MKPLSKVSTTIEEKRNVAMKWLRHEFKNIENVIDVSNRNFTAKPVFGEGELNPKNFLTQYVKINDVAFLYRSYSPSSHTKSYYVIFQIL